VTTIASMPVDIAKTRLQNQKYVDGEQFVIIASCQCCAAGMICSEDDRSHSCLAQIF
jgi:hypothetical protein